MTSGKFATTLGYERRFNPAFLYDDREEFIAFMTHDQPSRPANMQEIVAINQGRLPLCEQLPEPAALTAVEVHSQVRENQAVLLDIRDVDAFGSGHAAGSLNIQLSSSQFEQRVGWLVPSGTGIVLAAESVQSVRAAVKKLAFIGMDSHVTGYLQGGPGAWKMAGLPWNGLPQRPVDEISELLQSGPAQVLDVRERDEWESGHIAGAHWMSYRRLPGELDALPLDRAGQLVVVCASGYRSSTAASILQGAGFKHVANMVGGMDAWKKAGLPVEVQENEQP